MKLNILTHICLLSLSFLIACAQFHAHPDASTLFRREDIEELLERDLVFDIELLRRAFGQSIDDNRRSRYPALRAHEEAPLPAFDPRLYKTTTALTPGSPPSSPPPSPPSSPPPIQRQQEQAQHPATQPTPPESHLLSPHLAVLPDHDDHYASDRSSVSTGSTGSASTIVDRRKNPPIGGRSHAYPHGKDKRDDVELAAPLFLQAKLKNRDIDIEDFLDFFDVFG